MAEENIILNRINKKEWKRAKHKRTREFGLKNTILKLRVDYSIFMAVDVTVVARPSLNFLP